MTNKLQGLIDYLVGRQFPKDQKRRARPSKPRVATTIARIQKLMVQYRGELNRLSETELAERARLERERETPSRLSQAEREGESTSNRSYSNVDFEKWGRASSWTIDQAVALSFGRPPEHVNWQTLQPLLNVSPFAPQFKRRRELLLKAAGLKELRNPTAPSAFLTWAKSRSLAVPPELETAVSHGSAVAEWEGRYSALKTKFEEKEEKWRAQIGVKSDQIEELRAEVLDLKKGCVSQKPDVPLATKERDSLFKMIICMAIGGYGYEPTDTRSKQPAAIASDIAAEGLSLDVDTVRKWLKSAAELLPSEERERAPSGNLVKPNSVSGRTEFGT